MTDTLFEQLGGTYTQQGDYLLPNLTLPAEKETDDLSVERLKVLEKELAELKESYAKMSADFNAEKEGITEQLKSTDQMKWVGKMNAIRNAATEIINRELIYT